MEKTVITSLDELDPSVKYQINGVDIEIRNWLEKNGVIYRGGSPIHSYRNSNITLAMYGTFTGKSWRVANLDFPHEQYPVVEINLNPLKPIDVFDLFLKKHKVKVLFYKNMRDGVGTVKFNQLVPSKYIYLSFTWEDCEEKDGYFWDKLDNEWLAVCKHFKLNELESK